MKIRSISIVVSVLLTLGFILLKCALPTPPEGADAARISLFLKSSKGETGVTSITGIVDKFDTVGLVLNLTQYIDSATIEVKTGEITNYHFVTKTKKNMVDTVYYIVSFPTAGDRSVTATGYIFGYPNSEAAAIIHVVKAAEKNHPPTLEVTGTRDVTAGETVTLTTIATDPDSNQFVTVTAEQLPEGAELTADTLRWTTVLPDTGTDTLLFIATDNGSPAMTDTDTVIVTISAPAGNQPPVLTVFGRHVAVAGSTVVLTVAATDPDTTQAVTVEAIYLPEGATFEDDTLRWTTTMADTGIDSALFVATDNGEPALTDTEVVTITITETLQNTPPVWSEDTLRLEGESGVEFSRSLADLCSDVDGDTIMFTLLSDELSGDTIKETTWSLTPSDNDTGMSYFQIVAFDEFDGTDTLQVELTVTATGEDEDLDPPVMALVTPAEDSMTVASDEFEVTVSCKDKSGTSVICILGEDTFEVTRSEDTLFSAMITGLVSAEWTTVQFIGTDDAPAENRDTLYVSLRYDPEATDENPPSITLISPSSDTVIGESTLAVRVRCTDESGVAHVTIGGVEADREDDNVFSATVSDLTAGDYQTITIIATDSAETPHTDSTSVQVKYDDDEDVPEITLVTLDKDSVSTGLDSYTVTLACTDGSGVTSVVGAMGAESFTGEHAGDDQWNIAITGLAEGEYSEVTFTVTDSSLRENTTTKTVYVKYDPTIEDEIGPMITLVSPAEDTIVAVDSCVVTVRCTDQSGVASVAMVVGVDTTHAVEGSDHQYSVTIKNLEANQNTTVAIIAVDSAEAGNSASTSLQVMWKYVPVYEITIEATDGNIVRDPELDVYDSGTVVTFTAVSANGFHFTGWDGDLTGTDNPDTITMHSAKSVTALFEENAPNAFTLSVVALHGTVTKTPSQAQYDSGSTVGLKAVADAGYHFVDWTGDATGSDDTATITMNATRNVTANFSIDTYALNITATNGSVTRSPDHLEYNSGTEVELTPVPASGYHFTGWDGDLTGSDDPATITIDGAKSVTALFEENTPNSFALSVVALHGTVTKIPSQAQYDSGSTVGLKAVAAAGYKFVDWSGDASGTDDAAMVIMDAGKSVTANFAIESYALSVTATHGTVTRSPNAPSYDYNTDVKLTAVPVTGYRFTGWSGDLSGTANPETITMDEAKGVTANFAIESYALSVTATHGTVTRVPNATSYDYNTDVELTAVPVTGYRFTGWSGDLSGIANPETITMNAGKGVTANFEIESYALSVTATHGTVTRLPNATSYDYNTDVELAAVPVTGYRFTGWSGDLSGITNPETITMDEAKGVTANFEIESYALSVTATHGTVTRLPNATSYDYNTDVELAAVSATGYRFTGWSGDLSGIANPETITMDEAKGVTATFTPIQYLLTLLNDGHGTTVPSGDITVNSGVATSIAATPANGYRFSKWVVTSGVATISTSASPNTVSLTTDNATVSANFSALPFYVTFNKNDSYAIGTMSNQQIYCGSTVSLNSNSFSKPCGIFEGWANSTNGDVVYKDEGSVTMGAENLDLYAVWSDGTPPTVVISGPSEAVCEGTDVTLSAPTGTGYYTYLWSTGSTSRQLLVSDITKGQSGYYSCTVTDEIGCEGWGQIWVSVDDNSSGTISISPSDACEGEVVTFTSSVPGAYEYVLYLDGNEWGTFNSNVFSITANTTDGGDYTCRVRRINNGCISDYSPSASLKVSDGPFVEVVPEDNQIAEPYNGAYWMRVDYVVGSGDFTYKWYKVGNPNPVFTEVTGNEYSVYAPTANCGIAGTYYVKVSDENGCTATRRWTVSFQTGCP